MTTCGWSGLKNYWKGLAYKKGPEPKLRAFLTLTLGEKVPVTRNQFTGTGIDVNYFRTSAIWPLRLFHRVTAKRGLIFPSRFA